MNICPVQNLSNNLLIIINEGLNTVLKGCLSFDFEGSSDQ